MKGQSELSELSVISCVSAIQGCPRGSTVRTQGQLEKQGTGNGDGNGKREFAQKETTAPRS